MRTAICLLSGAVFALLPISARAQLSLQAQTPAPLSEALPKSVGTPKPATSTKAGTGPKPATAAKPATRSGGPGKVLHGFMARSTNGDQATKFLEGAQKIYVFWKGDALKTGDRVHIIWIAENIGFTNRTDRKITEGFSTAYKPDDDGAFSLSRPSGGWPVGKYRVELYVGLKLAETLHFTIEPDVTVQVN